MIKLLPLAVLLLSFQAVNAQFYKPKKETAGFADSLAVIVKDFKKNFSSVEGNRLPTQGDMEVFQCKVSVPGAMNAGIYRYHSLEDTTASWQALMYEGDDYAAAVNIYKETFKQLKKAKMKWVDNSLISFMGEMQPPTEDVRFTVSSLRLSVIDLPYRRFFAEVELNNTFEGWEVHLNLHNKRNDAARY